MSNSPKMVSDVAYLVNVSHFEDDTFVCQANFGAGKVVVTSLSQAEAIIDCVGKAILKVLNSNGETEEEPSVETIFDGNPT